MKSDNRKDKNCLNCGYTVERNFCSNCGQENLEPKESFWQFLTHLFRLNLALDGKFIATLKKLVTRPGFVSREYMAGRRASYIHPIRMYLFFSFILFIAFFSFFNVKKIEIHGKPLSTIKGLSQDQFDEFTSEINNGIPMSREDFKHYSDSMLIGNFHFTEDRYKSKEQYDSLLKAGVVSDSWLKRQDTYKRLEINERFKNNYIRVNEEIFEATLHSIPRIMILSLPILALFLKLIYTRQKQFYYVGHAIFTVHFLIIVFFSILIMLGIAKVANMAHLNWINYLNWVLGLSLIYYLFKAMRYFYGEKIAKTIFKCFLFSMAFFATLFLLFVFFFVESFYAV